MPAADDHGWMFARRPRPWKRLALVLVVLVLVLISATVGVLLAVQYEASQSTALTGFVGTEGRQAVASSAGGFGYVCLSPNDLASCVYVVGMTSVGSSGLAVITYTNGANPAGGLGVGEFNLTLGVWADHVTLGCDPQGGPFYPGQGEVAFFGCWTRGVGFSVVGFDLENGSIVGNFSIPSTPMAWGFVPASDRLLVGVDGGEVLALNTTTGATVASGSVGIPGSGSDSSSAWSYLSWSLLYDPFDGLVISQTNTSNLVALNPGNLSQQKEIPTGAAPWAIAVDGANDRLYISTGAGTVLAYNASTLDPVATIGISSCDGSPDAFTADQMILTPSQGDLLLQGFSYCLAVLNTTGNYAESTLPWGGDGYGYAVYNPADQLLWTWYPGDLSVSPVYLGSLNFTTQPELVSVVGLPPVVGEAVIVALIWVAGGCCVYVLIRSYRHGQMAKQASSQRKS